MKIFHLLLFILSPALFILGCPQDMDLRFQFVESYSGSKEPYGNLSSTMGIKVARVYDSIGCDIFVADTKNDRIVLFDSRNDSITNAFGGSGSGDGQFSNPRSLSITQSILYERDKPLPTQMYIYVADTKNHRIQKFDLNGNYILKWGQFGTDNGEFNSPTGIDLDFEGNIYVVDSGNHRIQVFDTLGNFIRSWGGYGTEDGEFDCPIDIEVGLKDYDVFEFVAVSDHKNNRVQLFDRNGNFIKKYTNIPDVLGISVEYLTPYGHRKIAAISAESRKLYLVRDSSTDIYNITGMVSPYDISRFYVTDSTLGIINFYNWVED